MEKKQETFITTIERDRLYNEFLDSPAKYADFFNGVLKAKNIVVHKTLDEF